MSFDEQAHLKRDTQIGDLFEFQQINPTLLAHNLFQLVNQRYSHQVDEFVSCFNFWSHW
jgi:hypothetical protein